MYWGDIIFNNLTKGAQLINYIPLIINISDMHSSIRNNQHYHGIHQYSEEMVIVFSLIVTFTKNPLIFRPENL